MEERDKKKKNRGEKGTIERKKRDEKNYNSSEKKN